MGEWCTITTFTKDVDGHNWVYVSFANPQGSTPWPLVKANSYTGFYLGLSGGLIVGLPNIPEVGTEYPVVTCFDLACRNCYEVRNTTPRLTLQEGGYAFCSKCQRTYSLNNMGQVAKGDAGQPLYRYRVYYGNNTLSINNP